MSRFAAGKYAYGISDRSGFRYRLKDMRMEWNGSLVGKDEYEPKHPQLDPKRRPTDPEAIKNARPDPRTEPEVIRLLTPNCFKSGAIGSSVITVTEFSHGRTTNSAVRFRNVSAFDGFSQTVLENSLGYIITVLDENRYTFAVTTGSATLGNTRGGGENATAGPGTATAPTASPTFDSTGTTLDSTSNTFDEA